MRRLLMPGFALTTLMVSMASMALVPAQTPAPAGNRTGGGGKELLLPKRIGQVPEGNDFDNPESEFAFKRSRATPNMVLFWAKEYGDDPLANPVAGRRFNVDEVVQACEKCYAYYFDKLEWLDKRKSLAARYKFLVFVTGGDNNTAYGGSIDNKIGAFWTPATRIHRGPYGVIAHELGHSFQAIGRADGAASFAGGSIGEMTSQFMLWQVYPEWMTFENYHLNDFMKATHLAFLHEDNQYHSPYVLEYWSEKRGLRTIGRLWREVRPGEDPVLTYQRMFEVTQEAFNDEIFDAARRFVTWDMPRIRQVASRYANQHTTSIVRADDGWFRIAPENCPQNYGYNAIQLKVPNAGGVVKVAFEGQADAPGSTAANPEKAGWRYGFLASRANGERVYGTVNAKSPGAAAFTVPPDAKFLWLVVTGAPTSHWIHKSEKKGGKPAQWPYRFKLAGTTPDDSIIRRD